MEENEVSSSLHQHAFKTNKTLDTQFSEELHDMKTMGNQEIKGYIEEWFHSIISLQHHSILQSFLAPSLTWKLVSHTLIFIDMDFSNSSMYVFLLFMRPGSWALNYSLKYHDIFYY